jgi:hypothetical protein
MENLESCDNLLSPSRIRSVFVSPISTNGAPRYEWGRLIENFFGELMEFKRIALRTDKADASFSAIVQLAAALINSR